MRHGDKVNNLGRKASHRKAMLKNMASSLILHKRISTTVAKAKALRVYFEPLVTRAKDNTTHSRRMVFSYLQNKESVKELFGPIASKVGDRPGGYTRIIKTGFRLGDGAQTAMIELVDYNELLLASKNAQPKKKRSRRSGGTLSTAAAATAAAVVVAPAATEVVEVVEGFDPEFDRMDDSSTVAENATQDIVIDETQNDSTTEA
jgi:large subunit ribosomal protein L17